MGLTDSRSERRWSHGSSTSATSTSSWWRSSVDGDVEGQGVPVVHDREIGPSALDEGHGLARVATRRP